MKKIAPWIIGITCCLFSIQSLSAAVIAKKENGNIILKNNNVELIFSDGKDFIFQELRIDGFNILPADGSTTYPWQLIYKGPNGENPTLLPKWGDYKGGEIFKDKEACTVAFTWQMVIDAGPTCPVSMSVTLRDESELPEWHIEVEMPEGWVITESEFPRIAVNRPDDAKAILSVGYGTEYNTTSEGLFQSRYPSCTGCMQLVLMHSKEGAVYFAAHDQGGSGKIFKMKSEGKRIVFSQNVTTSHAWTKDKKFSLPWATVMGFSKKGWQDAVERWYRPFTFRTEWGTKTIGERKIATWVKNADMWLRPMKANAETMEAVRQAMKYYGKGTGLHWYYWHHYPFDTKYPEYFPTQPDFAKMVKETQSLGGFVTPYINGRLWDCATESYKERNGKEASCRKPDGTLYTEVYSSEVLNTVTCPASSIWRGIQKEVVSRILSEVGTNGVYIDQIGAASSEPCYAANHDHPLGGGDWWPNAYRTLIHEMRANMKDDKAITTEENAECYIDLFDMMLLVNTPHGNGIKMVPLFPLVYSDRCIYSGYTYIPGCITDGSLNFMTMRSLLWGSQLGWAEPGALMKENTAKEAKFLKDLAGFRHKQQDLFLGGRYLGEVVPEGDNPTREITNYGTTPLVLAAEWLSLKGEHVYLVVNMDEKEHIITLPGDKQVKIAALSALRIKK